MDSCFYDVQCILKKGQKSDSFSAHYYQHFKHNMLHNDLCKCMGLKVVNHINADGEMKSFIKPNFNLFLEEWLLVLKYLYDRNVTPMRKILEI